MSLLPGAADGTERFPLFANQAESMTITDDGNALATWVYFSQGESHSGPTMASGTLGASSGEANVASDATGAGCGGSDFGTALDGSRAGMIFGQSPDQVTIPTRRMVTERHV